MEAKCGLRSVVRLLSFLALLFLLPCEGEAQQADWREAWHQVMDDGDYDEETLESLFEQLEELAEHPIDLNKVTRDELEELPFLSARQVMDFIEYRDRFYPLRSMNELRVIPSFDYVQSTLLPCFAYVGEVSDSRHFPSLRQIVRGGTHEVMASGRIPFYERKGDEHGYAGYRYRHALRYDYHYGDYFRMGLVGSQDAGEPFFASVNKKGYDAYSYYLQMKHLGPVETAIIGKYKVAAGMGLVLGSSFQLGKLTLLQNMGRAANTLRPHASRSESDYFEGAAATLQLWPKLRLTAFASLRPIDATLRENGSAQTLITSGYHRTQAEIQKKHNTRQSSAGGVLAFRAGGFQANATMVATHLNRRLSPQTTTLYRRYYPQGYDFMNASLGYGYTHYRFAVNGETAIDQEGHLATLHTVSVNTGKDLQLMALHRYYSYRYTTLHGHAFGEGSRVQNEQGVYVGGIWQALRKLRLSFYADYAYFPWARYQVSRPSSAHDYLLEAQLRANRQLTVTARYRFHQKERDDAAKTRLTRIDEHRMRLALNYASGLFSTVVQADAVRTVGSTRDKGFMMSSRVGWKAAQWQLTAMGAWFRTDSYASRLYVYEPQLPHEFGFPSYDGHGYRLSLAAQLRLGNMRVGGKLGHTHYFDRTTIGSGLQLIPSSHQTDLELQIGWKLGGKKG